MQIAPIQLRLMVLAALLLLGVAIALFRSAPVDLPAADEYCITFTNAGGVELGMPVCRSGMKIGEVTSVELDNATGEVIVTVRVEKKYRLPTSSRPVVAAHLAGGKTVIDFVSNAAEPKIKRHSQQAILLVGYPDRVPADRVRSADPQRKKKPQLTMHKPGALLRGITQIPAEGLVQKKDKKQTLTEETMREIKKVFQKLDKMAPLFEESLKESKELAKSAREIVTAVNDTNLEIQKLITATQKSIPDLKRTNNEIQVTVRNWGRVGERLDVFLQTNEAKVVKSFEDVQTILKQLTNVFSDENQQNLRVTLNNAAKSSRRLEGIAKNTEELLKASRKTVVRVGDSLERADRVFANLEKITQPLAQRGGSPFKNVDEAMAETKKAMCEMRALLRVVTQSDGTMQRFLSDPTLFKRLDLAAYNFNRLLPRINRILCDTEIFADRLARHPELIGLSGAIRPSSGLKELPSRPFWRLAP